MTSPPRGIIIEGVINDTSKPGTVMQIDTSVAETNGRFAWKAAALGTDGYIAGCPVLCEDSLQGKLFTDAYVAGTYGRLYFPIYGEELNLLLGEVAGTGNTYAINDRLMLDADDGIMVPFIAGSSVSIAALCLETLTQVAGSKLTRCLWAK